MEAYNKALSKAKVQLMSFPDLVFFTTVLFSLKFLWDEKCNTAYTNGTVLGINPKWFMTLSPDERMFLLVHEACHVAYMHMLRLMDRDPRQWNEAADHVINLMLIARGFRMPKDGLADPKYIGMSTEEVYKLLPKPDPNKKPMDMDLREPDGEPEAAKEELQEILVRASVQTKMQEGGIGSIPGEIQIFLDKLLAPKLPWNRILLKYLHSMSKCDYSFRKPNRRFFPKYHLPSLYSQSLMDIAIAVDASGSVTDHDFKVFVSETNGILRMMNPEKLTLVQFDGDIRSVDCVGSVQELSKVKFTGRGGTMISPVIQWANENKPKLLLVFTDGEFKFYDYPCDVTVIWLIHNNPDFRAPYGKVIHYEI